MKFIPPALLLLLALFFLGMSRQGDNSDARALAGIFIFPAIGFAIAGVLAGAIAWWL